MEEEKAEEGQQLSQTPVSGQARQWSPGPSISQAYEGLAEEPVRGSAWAEAMKRDRKKMSTLKADLGCACSKLFTGGGGGVRLPEIAGCGIFPVSLLPQQLTCVMVSVVLLTC